MVSLKQEQATKLTGKQRARQDGHGCLLRPPSGYHKRIRTLALLPCHRIFEDVTTCNIAVSSMIALLGFLSTSL
jgi:hypothetical protein